MMRHTLAWLLSAWTLSVVGVGAEAGAPQPASAVVQRFVAIDNVCAWPNLTMLRDGTIMATIFNQPTHGGWEGDVECWASRDGRLWEKRGTPAPHEPGTNRMNVAAGLARDGSLVVLASGWSKRPASGTYRSPHEGEVLPVWICRSSDQGRTWTHGDAPVPPPANGPTHLVPFGDIVTLADGALGVCLYGRSPKTKELNSCFYASRDDGRTWSVRGVVRAGNITETTPVVLPSGRLLAAGRTFDDQHLDLFSSDDHGATWKCTGPITAKSQHPADLMLLADGRLLLTYGNRIAARFGVEAKISADEGATWSDPISLVSDLTSGDCGYPSSVQLSSGEILTAYYAAGVASHRRYHVGVLQWKPPAATARPAAKAPIKLGSRRELFVDDYLIDELSGASLQLHRPTEREVVLRCDRPWEGAVCGYFNVFQDGDKYRMYYRGWDARFSNKTLTLGHAAVLCYAESTNGVEWKRPNLGLFEFQGSKENNIVWIGKGFDNVAVLKDTNPKAPASQRYKALGGYPLSALVSADGVHWQKLQEAPVIAKGAFDSQNLAFYDPLRQEYVAYFRGFRKGVRDILMATSRDFVHWDDDRQRWITRSDGREEHLYTNATTPYFRAPQIYIALPMRYEPTRPMKDGKSDGMYGVTDAVFMTSRDGVRFDRRFLEAFIRPGLEQDRWITRNNCPAWGIVPTKSQDVKGQEELSVYWTEGYYTPGCRLRRGTLRLDGFVSVNAPSRGGQFVTKPLTFTGKALTINYSTSAAGSVVVELQDADGKPIPGRDAKSCPEIYGDAIEQVVAWKDGSDISQLAGLPVRLRFVMKDADVYSIQFTK